MMRDERMTVCPTCGRPHGAVRFGVPVGTLAARIIDAVTHAGDDGISGHDLFELVYRDRAGAKAVTLKAYIYWINQKIADSGFAIRNDCWRRGYRLIKIKPELQAAE